MKDDDPYADEPQERPYLPGINPGGPGRLWRSMTTGQRLSVVIAALVILYFISRPG